MKGSILIVFMSVTFGLLGSKTQLLKDYNFNQGGYYILGLKSESDRSTLQDSMGEFYTDDTVVLNKFKQTWIFKTPGKGYSCGYHYNIFICKNGQILTSFSVNLNCNELATDDAYFYFNPQLLRQFYNQLKKPNSTEKVFTSAVEARNYRQKILLDTLLIVAFEPGWIDYEGSFRFTYNCKAGTKDCIDEDHKLFNKIKAEIKKQYPNEPFELEEVGGSWTTMELLITCNKSLSDSFNLYTRDRENYFGKWAPFELKIETFWR